nr:MAG TPA: hypothetical protein [Caudoviricetes sp.]
MVRTKHHSRTTCKPPCRLKFVKKIVVIRFAL